MSGIEATGPNADQIAFWNSEGGKQFIRHRNAVNAMIEPFGDKVLEATGLHKGEKVLDIGCGCGDTTIEIARRVGPTGEAVGVDISEVMLARAEDSAAHADVTNVFFELADVETSPLHRDSFDLAFSRFGVMFFADPVRAFSNVRDVLHNQGRLGFVCWQAPDKNPWLSLPFGAVVEALGIEPEAAQPFQPGPFAFSDKDRVSAILADAGFGDIKIEAYTPEITLFGARNLDEAVNLALDFGPARQLLEHNPGASVEKARAAIAAALEPHMTPRGPVLGSGAWIVTANT